ncbi:MAG: DUF4173 domain-containing protein [Algicola sp.]|nr:DUF4173 domain-containing protein [Algicola sp.]
MEIKEKLSMAIFGTGLLGGLIGRYLFMGAGAGINFTVYVFMVIGAVLGFRHVLKRNTPLISRVLIYIALFFAFFIAVRDSVVVFNFNLLGLAIIATMAIALEFEGSVYQFHFVRLLRCGFRVLIMPVIALLDILPGAFSPLGIVVKDARVKSVLKGLFWALPLLLIFGSLLVSSDARFAEFTASLIDFDVFTLSNSLMITGFWMAVTMAILFAALVYKTPPEKFDISERIPVVDGIVLITMLGCINLLFCCYIAIQFTYFFGGDALVHNTSGLTYSAYARNGFWDLVWVAMIALPLLYLADCMLFNRVQNESEKIQNVFRKLALFTVIAIFIMEGSAAHRMYIYVREYQLTELRFYSTWYMCFIVSALFTFVATVLKGKRELFIISTAFCALGFIALLNLINPDALIVSRNLAQMEKGHTIDQHYLNRLSHDAYPDIVQYAQAHPKSKICFLVLEGRGTSKLAWQSWTWSNFRAVELWHESPAVKRCIENKDNVKEYHDDSAR